MKINFLYFTLVLLFFVSACTKITETEIGTGLIPSVDGVITKDTNIYVDAKNGRTDTITPSLADDHALGYIKDPLFGTTMAAINVQMQPATFPFSFEASGSSDSLILDSVVLALNYQGAWGDTNQLLSLHVKEIDNTQKFDTSTTYNNRINFTATNELTYNGFALIDPRKANDTFDYYQDSNAVNMVRIRLTDDFGNRLLHTYNSVQYLNDSTFRSAFRGFQISADAAIGNSLLRIGLTEANTKLAIYYRYKAATTSGDSATVKYFAVNTTSSAHSNFIKRDLEAGQAGPYYPTIPTPQKNDPFIYIQSSPGTYADITVDSAAVSGLPNWIIHRAELMMEEAPDESGNSFEQYATAPYLFLLAKAKDSTKFNIPGFDSLSLSTSDALFQSDGTTGYYALGNYASFGGFPFTRQNSTNQQVAYYTFDVSRYIQGIVTKKNPQYKFTLYTPYNELFPLLRSSAVYGYVSTTLPNPAGVGRVRLYGGNRDSTDMRRMRLHIVYSIPH